ncbi:MAG: hypothetical protein ACQEWG_16930 [Bacteroidota bacterium]
MKNLKHITGLLIMISIFNSCEKESIALPEESTISDVVNLETKAAKKENSKGFVHGIIVEMDRWEYYLAGAPDGTKD